jgi:hypothetical protein
MAREDTMTRFSMLLLTLAAVLPAAPIAWAQDYP